MPEAQIDKAIDRCVQCGFCLTACPTYRIFNTEESSPRGRIALAKAVRRDEVEPTAENLATFSECLGCRACESACPSGVHYEEILMFGRERLAEALGPPPLQARLLLWAIRSPGRIALLSGLWGALGRVVRGIVRLFSPRRGPLALLAALPVPRPETVEAGEKGAEVALHQGCLMHVFWGGTNGRAVKLLRRAGMTATLMPEATGCCGALHDHQGQRETARALARRVIDAYEASGAQVFVTLAGGCGAFVKEYPFLFEEDDPYHEKARRIAQNVRDVASLLREAGFATPAGQEATTYQDSCHLRHGMKVWREPRDLLRESGAYHELPSAGQCCGSAGIYNILRPDVSDRIIGPKVEEAQATGARVVVTSNPGCELQWRLGVRRARAGLDVRHIVDHIYDLADEEGNAG